MNGQFEELQKMSLRYGDIKLVLCELHFMCNFISNLSPDKQNYVRDLVKWHTKKPCPVNLQPGKLSYGLQIMLWTFVMQST